MPHRAIPWYRCRRSQLDTDEWQPGSSSVPGATKALFGSVRRGQTHAASDVDRIVQFAPGAKTYAALVTGASRGRVMPSPDLGLSPS